MSTAAAYAAADDRSVTTTPITSSTEVDAQDPGTDVGTAVVHATGARDRSGSTAGIHGDVDAVVAQLMACHDEERNPFYSAWVPGPLSVGRMVLQGLVLVPLRCLALLGVVVVVWGACALATCGSRDYELHLGHYKRRPPGRCRTACARRVSRCGARSILCVFGVCWMRVRRPRQPRRGR